jgi:hypothetical protein
MFGRFVVIGIAAAIVSFDSVAQQSFQQFESVTQFERALTAIDAIKHRKKLQCIMAIANGTLCECFSQKLPVDTYIRSYASIVNQGKGEFEYGQLSAADKKIVDQCVSDSP